MSDDVVNRCPDCLVEAWERLYWDAVRGYLYDENENDAARIDAAAEALERLGYWEVDDEDEDD